MGTKVQCKSYSPVCYSIRDLNEDANHGSWPVYYDDKLLKSEPYGDCFMKKSRIDAYPEYDKEILKQTMFEHETVFRNQVYELHRLYRTQRDLMNELKRNELHKYTSQVEASQSSPFSPLPPSEDARRMWQIPSFPLASSSCSRSSVSGVENMQSPLNFIKESSMQVTPYPVQNGSTFKEHESLESMSKQVPRRMFDLQLPADEYLDSDGERIEEETVLHTSSVMGYPLKGKCGIDIKLSLGGSGKLNCPADASKPDSRLYNRHELADLNQPVYVEENPAPAPFCFLGTSVQCGETQGKDLPEIGSSRNLNCQGDATKSDSRLCNRHELADLNQPVQVEEKTTPAPFNFLGTASHCGEIHGNGSPAKPNYPSFPRGFFQSMQKDMNIGSHMNGRRPENEGTRERPYNLEAGQSRGDINTFGLGFCSGKAPTRSESVQDDFKRGHEHPAFSACDYNKREPWRERAVCGIEIPQSSQSLSNHNYLTSVQEPRISSSYLFVSRSDDRSESPSILSWMKPIINFSEKSTEGNPSVQHKLIGSEWHFSSNPRLNSSSGREISYKNGFCHGSQSEASSSKGHINNDSALEHSENHSPTKYSKGPNCMDVKTAKVMNLNLALPNGFHDRAVTQHDLVIIDAEGKNDDPPQGLPWLRAKSACNNAPGNGKGSLDGTGLSSLCSLSHPVTHKTVENGKVPSVNFTNESSDKVGDWQDNSRIFDITIFYQLQISKDQNSLSSPSKFQCPSEGEEIKNIGRVCNIDLSRCPAQPDSELKQSSQKLNGLDLVRCGFKTDINLNLCIDEEENPSTPCIPRSTVKIAFEIDLEAPLVPDSLEGIPPDGDCSIVQHPECVQSSSTRKDPLEELERIASEAIVFMSSTNNLEGSAFKSMEGSLNDSLDWFADIVSSNMANLESDSRIISRDCEETTGEFDYFEVMTLKLSETKLDDVSCKIWVPEDPKEEETGNSTLLMRRRRGQSRRGRQKRDFQRDILPGLTSLSRHEVTEDLQAFGGLMRATGHPWQIGLTRRNAARNGSARARGRTQGPAPTVVDPAPPVVCSLLREQPNNLEVVGLEERSLKGWGKTTRRPRRQRPSLVS